MCATTDVCLHNSSLTIDSVVAGESATWNKLDQKTGEKDIKINI